MTKADKSEFIGICFIIAAFILLVTGVAIVKSIGWALIVAACYLLCYGIIVGMGARLD